jgi:HisA/HisF family protein
MQIIPVIDLKNGLVVHAVKGERAAYRPIATPLSKTSRPADVIQGYLRVFPFQTIYIADLNAIEGDGDNNALIATLTQSFPRLDFWIDAGARLDNEHRKGLSPPRVDAVIGSENLSSLCSLPHFAKEPRALLSLDFRNDKFLGPSDLLARSDVWPNRVIVMTMTRVGANVGPDIEAISNIKARAGEREVFAAGGVRNARDLELLAEVGAAGALVASALHNGALSTTDIRGFIKK